jgi:hypothetical protein
MGKIEAPIMYLYIYERFRQTGVKEITNEDLQRILGKTFKIKKVIDKQVILKEMEKMGLLKKGSQQLWQINLEIKPIDEIKHLLYKEMLI